MIIFGSFAFDSRTWCVFEESLSFSGVCLWFSLMMLYIFHVSVSLEQLVAPAGDPVSGLIFFCFFSWAGREAAAYWQTHCCVFTVMRRCTTFRCNISQLQIAWSLVTVAAAAPHVASSLLVLFLLLTALPFLLLLPQLFLAAPPPPPHRSSPSSTLLAGWRHLSFISFFSHCVSVASPPALSNVTLHQDIFARLVFFPVWLTACDSNVRLVSALLRLYLVLTVEQNVVFKR